MKISLCYGYYYTDINYAGHWYLLLDHSDRRLKSSTTCLIAHHLDESHVIANKEYWKTTPACALPDITMRKYIYWTKVFNMITVDGWLTSYLSLYSETEIQTATYTDLEVQLSWISNSFSANVCQLKKPRQVCCVTITSLFYLVKYIN